MTMYALILIAVGLPWDASDGPKDAAAAKEIKRFQGHWKVQDRRFAGKPLASKDSEPEYLFEGNRFIFKASGEVVSVAEFTVDPSKTPKALDMTYTKGSLAGKTLHLAYEIEATP